MAQPPKGNVSEASIAASLAGDDYALIYGATNKLRRVAPGVLAAGLLTGSNDIASAASIDLKASAGVVVRVTGTTGISSFGTVTKGLYRVVQFTGALTLTHGAALVLPYATDFTTVANDVLVFAALATDVWTCIGVFRSTRIAAFDDLFIKGSDVASASSVALGSMTGSYADLTGTTGITAFTGLAAGKTRKLRYTGSGLTITHNGTSLICPGSVDLALRAGDVIDVVGLGSNNAVIAGHMRANAREFSLTVTVPADVVGTWNLLLKATFAFTIISLSHKMSASAVTIANVKINSTNVTSLTTLSATTSLATAAASGANAVAIDDAITFETSGTPAASGSLLTVQLNGRR